MAPLRSQAAGVLAAPFCAVVHVGCARRAALSDTSVLAVPDRANARDAGLGGDARRCRVGGDRNARHRHLSGDERRGGARFGVPIRVNGIEGDATANGEQPPHATLHGRDVSILRVSKRNGVAVIRATASSDGGKTFAAARTITPAGVTGARGWESTTISDEGIIHAAWLDKAQPLAARGTVLQ